MAPVSAGPDAVPEAAGVKEFGVWAWQCHD